MKHKIDKATGLYLEWCGPTITPVSEMRDILRNGDATLDDLAIEVWEFLQTKNPEYKEIVRRQVVESLACEDDFGMRQYVNKMPLEESVFSYPLSYLAVLEQKF